MSDTTNFHIQILSKIEQDVLSSLHKIQPDIKQYTKDEILRTVFVNYRMVSGTPRGLRLTSFGNKILSKYYQIYKYPIEDEINHLVLISLDKLMKWPYYLGTKSNHVVFYSEEDAAWFRLNGNKITSYVESI